MARDNMVWSSLLTLGQNEPFSETKKRLEKRTGIKGKAFEKIKFALVKRYGKLTYLVDGESRGRQVKPRTGIHANYSADDVLYDDSGFDDDSSLGLDHVDRTRTARNGGAEMFLK